MTLLEFLMKAAQTRSSLARLLQTDFSVESSTPLHVLLNSLVRRWFLEDREFSELDVVRLEYLIKHLGEIEQYDPVMLREFRREFRRARTQDNLEGLRFECYAAASLARKNIQFSKSEAPDFIVDGQNAGLECTSVRLNARHPFKDLSYKIDAAIGKKERTESNRANVLLLIDITNVLYDSDISSVERLRPVARERISRTAFASVIMFCHAFEARGRRISTGYFREDSDKISCAMLGFVNSLFPKGEARIYDFYIPAAG